jgi:hypothetical protein
MCLSYVAPFKRSTGELFMYRSSADTTVACERRKAAEAATVADENHMIARMRYCTMQRAKEMKESGGEKVGRIYIWGMAVFVYLRRSLFSFARGWHGG